MLNKQIAEKLEHAFSQHGFAEPSVATLQKLSGVSLRTLYKYYPSKESMIVAALTNRHQRYLYYFASSSESTGEAWVTSAFEHLSDWMKNSAPHGCLSIQALAAYPNNVQIAEAVKQHKRDIQQLLAEKSGHPELSEQLFLLHEGIASGWPIVGDSIIASANRMVADLFVQYLKQPKEI
ncbi:TetR/AcrR family transcriptional regulator [Vibrio ulleungensis]|uniref:TetR/AcrR family transcriptional regulator n=1 Tax=Vibrio ulleungensis TaxID=2807619 RepID=A0ABS2HJX2_9VIBR|nr:TetR/AcrR family transcriptional regulator [Vibrio ulleungensis]MBM7036817.1 TetR/AcrR family transcriptional regulator [Vibrio ulleungensis]